MKLYFEIVLKFEFFFFYLSNRIGDKSHLCPCLFFSLPCLSCPLSLIHLRHQVTKRDEDSSLMQLKEEFRTYEALRREHDAQIVHIAMEAGLRISPEQWSSLLYGDLVHKSHMQSIIDKVSLGFVSSPLVTACNVVTAWICFLKFQAVFITSVWRTEAEE